MTLKNSLLSFFMILAFAGSNAQHNYTYQRSISGIEGQWHRIALPPELVGMTLQSLSDIRVLGVTEKGDTIEAPYLLKRKMEQLSTKNVPYNIINKSRIGNIHYFTFQVPGAASVGEIQTEFDAPNFDWKVNLEGSHNQVEWFTIAENYRILSIRNEQLNFQFSKIRFAPVNFPYLRLSIPSNENPELKNATLSMQTVSEGVWNTYPVKHMDVSNNRVIRNTVIDTDLGASLPVSRLSINVADSLDYYRSIVLTYLADSTQTEKGMVYHYSTLLNSTLHSLQRNEFTFSGTNMRKLRIEIFNGDNAPLSYSAILVQGYSHELLVRIAEPAEYFLVYGNPHAQLPVYDIVRFESNIPENAAYLQLGPESIIDAPNLEAEQSYLSKMWLWAVMAIIILLLGAFSLKMLTTK